MAALSPSWASEMTSFTPFEPQPHEIAQESRPKRLGLGGADVQADDLAPAIGVHRHGDYGGHRDNAPALAHLQVGRVQPQIRPLATLLQGSHGWHPGPD